MKTSTLQKARLSKGFSQREVARRLGISFSYYNKVERFLVRAGVDLEFKIAELLGIKAPRTRCAKCSGKGWVKR